MCEHYLYPYIETVTVVFELYVSCIHIYFFVFHWTSVKLTGTQAAAEFL